MAKQMTERQEKMTKVTALVSQGKSTAEACQEIGVSQSNFYAWRSEKKTRKNSKPQLIQVHQDNEDDEVKIVIMKGKSSTIEAIARSLGGLM